MAKDIATRIPEPNTICEACERAPAKIVDPHDEELPYTVCRACHRRLLARALRPLEWYNLAKRRGSGQFHLHDDFYLDDGTATQPETDVEHPELYPAPTLANVAGDAILLLDFSMTRWSIEDDCVKAWSKHPREVILDVLTSRYSCAANLEIRSNVLAVARLTLGEFGADFVRRAWDGYPENIDLWSLAHVSAKCLPFREGFDRVTQALSLLDENQRREKLICLMDFHSTETLDWIEVHAGSPVVDSWGYLAAASQFDWARAQKWLMHGRPLSLIALDAIGEIIRPQSFAMQKYRPKLLNPPTVEVLRSLLEAHQLRDDSPRVKKMTRFILEHSQDVTSG